MGLYVHVPFCRSLCTYCAFAKEEYTGPRADAWLEGLARELEVRAAGTWGRPTVDTVFIGGGTPSALTPSQWRRLGSLLGSHVEFAPGLEFTGEANPESLSKHPDRLEAMMAAGVNRVSLGVQSGNPQDLGLLGRAHGRGEVETAVALVREAGAALNLDLMYGLPNQTAAGLESSLDWILELGAEHLSAYCLGLEPGTPLAQDVAAGGVAAPEDDASREQYEILSRRLEASGLEPYEISNWSRPGAACRHNLKYWRRETFLAAGPSSHGLLGNRRWANPAPLEAWMKAYAGGRIPVLKEVPPTEARFEWVFLRLRLTEGLRFDDYYRTWGEPFQARYGETVERLGKQGFLAVEAGAVQLTVHARFLSDGVFAEFAGH